MKKEIQENQGEAFERAARAHGCNESVEVFDEMLYKIARHKLASLGAVPRPSKPEKIKSAK